jgi:hypothetical protein
MDLQTAVTLAERAGNLLLSKYLEQEVERRKKAREMGGKGKVAVEVAISSEDAIEKDKRQKGGWKEKVKALVLDVDGDALGSSMKNVGADIEMGMGKGKPKGAATGGTNSMADKAPVIFWSIMFFLGIFLYFSEVGDVFSYIYIYIYIYIQTYNIIVFIQFSEAHG